MCDDTHSEEVVRVDWCMVDRSNSGNRETWRSTLFEGNAGSHRKENFTVSPIKTLGVNLRVSHTVYKDSEDVLGGGGGSRRSVGWPKLTSNKYSSSASMCQPALPPPMRPE